MITCEKCKLIFDDGTLYCASCGSALAEPKTRDGRSDSDVHSLLASANLHRIRGEWDDAIEFCMDVLKLEPKNAECYSLLGDIYESRGQDEDAVQWFAMALDLEPSNKTDRFKLDKLREKFARLEASRLPPPPAGEGNWLDRFAGGRGFDSSMRIITAVSVVFVALLLLAGLLAFIWRSPRDEVILDETGQPILNSEQPVRVGPNPQLVPGGNIVATRPAGEQQLLMAISMDPRIGARGLVIEDVHFDPRVELAIITFRSPGRPTRESIAADAAAAAGAAFAAGPGTSWVMLRCCGTIGDPGAAAIELLFVADVGRSAATGIHPGLPVDQILRVFLKPWWNEKVQ